MLLVAIQPFIDKHTTHALDTMKIAHMADGAIRHVFAAHKAAGRPVAQPVLYRNIKDEVVLGAERLVPVVGDILPREHARMPMDRFQNERFDCDGPWWLGGDDVRLGGVFVGFRLTRAASCAVPRLT